MEQKIETTATAKLDNAKVEMQNWYDNEFMPYKKQQEQEKQNFNEFAKIVVNNSQEIKYMLANIYDNNSAKVVATWNKLGLDPKIKDIKLEGENLVIKDEKSKELSIKFDTLLNNIGKVLGA